MATPAYRASLGNATVFGASTQNLAVGAGAASGVIGDLIVLWGVLDATTANIVSSVTDSRGNTYTLAQVNDGANAFVTVFLAWARMGTALQAADNITVHTTGGANLVGHAALFASAATGADIAAQSNVGTSNTVWATKPSGVMSAQPELVLVAGGNSLNGTDTPNAGYTDDAVVWSAGPGRLLLAQYKITSATTTTTGGGTLNAAKATTSLILVLQAAGNSFSASIADTMVESDVITGLQQSGYIVGVADTTAVSDAVSTSISDSLLGAEGFFAAL